MTTKFLFVLIIKIHCHGFLNSIDTIANTIDNNEMEDDTSWLSDDDMSNNC